jgi:hypothetical protein
MWFIDTNTPGMPREEADEIQRVVLQCVAQLDEGDGVVGCACGYAFTCFLLFCFGFGFYVLCVFFEILFFGAGGGGRLFIAQ